MFFQRFYFFCLLFLYLLVGLALIYSNPPALGSDMFYYYRVAYKYSIGEFYYALNGYWAPFLPWLLALVFKTGVFWRALQLVNLAGGFVLIVYSKKTAALLKLSFPTTLLLLLLNTLLALAHQLDSTTPDFLSVVCFVVFVYYYFENFYHSSTKGWLKTAIASLALIFCKVFYFYFILAFIGIHTFYSLYNEKNKEVRIERIKNAAKEVTLVVVVYFIWVAALSYKYDRFIFSATGSYNSSLVTPKGNNPQYYTISGLVEPVNSFTIGNEDPTYAPVEARNPFASKEAMDYQLRIFAYNFKILVYLFGYFSYFKWLVLLVLPALFFLPRSDERDTAITLFLMGCLILAGYFLLFYEDRYVLPVLFCFVFACFYLFDRLYTQQNFIKVAVLMLPFVAFSKNSAHTIRLWQENLPLYEETMEVSQRLKGSKLFEGKRIANAADGYGWTFLNMLSLETSCVYYGELGMFHSHETNLKELEKYKIEYLFYFDCAKINEGGGCLEDELPFYLQNKPVVIEEPSARLKVYKLF